MILVRKSDAEIDEFPCDVQEQVDQRPIEWLEPPVLSLDDRGMIRDCNKPGEKLFGYLRSDLVWQHISKLLPQLQGIPLSQGGRFNPILDYLCHCGQPFQAKNREGDYIPSKLSFVHLEHDGKRTLRLIVNPAACASV